MTRSSGSRVHRLWKCPPSSVLPQVERVDESPAAGKGKHVHRYLETVGTIGQESALFEAPEELRPMLEMLDLETLPVKCSTEVAIAYHVHNRTARELGRGIGRDYEANGPLDPDEIPFTVDVVGAMLEIGVGLVVDYKTGRSRYPAPDKFGQLLLAGVGVRALFGFASVVADLIYIDTDEDGDGNHWRVRRTLDEWDLDIFADELARAWREADEAEALIARGGTPNVREGAHCDYCPATKSCPAKVGLVSNFPTEIATIEQRGGPMTVERAAEIWIQVERFASMLDMLKTELQTFADVQPFDLPDGRRVERVSSSRRGLDAKVTLAVLADRFGAETAYKTAKLTFSIDALRTLCAAKRQKGEKVETSKGTGTLDKLLDEIDNHGGLQSKISTYVKAHIPKK